MKVRKVVIWSLVNKDEWHPATVKDEQKIESLMPLVSELFPGINYFSVTGFASVMHSCVIPTLAKLHPQLIGISADHVADDELEIEEFLPSKGYEWQESKTWKSNFDSLLAAA